MNKNILYYFFLKIHGDFYQIPESPPAGLWGRLCPWGRPGPVKRGARITIGFFLVLSFWTSLAFSKEEEVPDHTIINCVDLNERKHCIQQLTTTTEREQTNGVASCWFVGNPIIIQMKNQCGTYCYARIKCGIKYVRKTDLKFSAGAFCKTVGKQCPRAMDCFSQTPVQNPEIASVDRVKDHPDIIGEVTQDRKLIETDQEEFDKYEPLMPHSTAAKQSQRIKALEKESAETIQRIQKAEAEAKEAKSVAGGTVARTKSSQDNTRKPFKLFKDCGFFRQLFGGKEYRAKCAQQNNGAAHTTSRSAFSSALADESKTSYGGSKKRTTYYNDDFR